MPGTNNTEILNNDTNLVNDIAKVNINGKKQFNFYSFATKYCSHHKPKHYPIYDSYVEKLLMALKKQDNFSKFHKSELRVYSNYKDILIKFRTYYNLEEFDLKQIDKYLWQAGKEFFPKSVYSRETSKERFGYTSTMGLSIVKKNSQERH